MSLPKFKDRQNETMYHLYMWLNMATAREGQIMFRIVVTHGGREMERLRHKRIRDGCNKEIMFGFLG